MSHAQVLNVAYSADGNYIAMSDKSENLRLIDVRNGKNKASSPPAWGVVKPACLA
jgi:hypothetical protein